MTQTAVRWSGVALVAAGLIIGAMLESFSLELQGQYSLPVETGWLGLVGAVLLMLALPGMYARQAEATGWLGLLGHVLLAVGNVLLIILTSWQLLSQSQPSLTPEGGVTVLALAAALGLGFVLTGVATLRAAVYPRWLGALLLLVGGGFLVCFYVGELLPPLGFAVCVAVLGLSLTVTLIWLGAGLYNSAQRSAQHRVA